VQVLKEGYLVVVPRHLQVVAWILGLIGLCILLLFSSALYSGTSVLGDPEVLGQQGDFFGGHVAAFVGCITLLVVVITGYFQVELDRKFRIKEHFINGINVISNYDIKEPGCEQAMRLLDYYASIALAIGDAELLLMLNTVMTKRIREEIRDIEQKRSENYPNAVAARAKIQVLLEKHFKAKKGLTI